MSYLLAEKHIRALESLVVAGEFASVDDALDIAIAHLTMIDESDEFDWAIPLIAEADAEFARGEGVPLSEVKAKLDDCLKSRGG